MLRRTLYALVIYVFGAIGLPYWLLAGFNAGAPREDWALMIVLPAARQAQRESCDAIRG